jgi:hypothetical protein
MSRVNWKKLKSQIPPRVRIGKRDVEIVWISDFKNDAQVGEARFEHDVPFQIVLRLDETDKETVHTYLHEIAHAISGEEEMGLTEGQVEKFENSLKYLLKPGNVFKGKK